MQDGGAPRELRVASQDSPPPRRSTRWPSHRPRVHPREGRVAGCAGGVRVTALPLRRRGHHERRRAGVRGRAERSAEGHLAKRSLIPPCERVAHGAPHNSGQCERRQTIRGLGLIERRICTVSPSIMWWPPRIIGSLPDFASAVRYTAFRLQPRTARPQHIRQRRVRARDVGIDRKGGSRIAFRLAQVREPHRAVRHENQSRRRASGERARERRIEHQRLVVERERRTQVAVACPDERVGFEKEPIGLGTRRRTLGAEADRARLRLGLSD